MRKNITDIQSSKGREPIICLTAYSYPIAKILDDYCDILLVGDSVGMAVYGMKDTLSVTVDMMINHARAVVSATKKALIVVDLPYGSYEKSPQQALETANKIISQTNCDAVKLESPADMAPIISYLVENGIKVMGHIGLMPQHINELGGYKYQGRNESQAKNILNDALKITQAGAFAMVIEGVTESLAREITAILSIPVIGIGASNACDGQILVVDDMLGLTQDFQPRFVKNYADLTTKIKQAVQEYSKEVKSRQFPALEHCFGVKK
jgi:3-methyl-2-oxobutanoate hydroxymethyltransferase